MFISSTETSSYLYLRYFSITVSFQILEKVERKFQSKVTDSVVCFPLVKTQNEKKVTRGKSKTFLRQDDITITKQATMVSQIKLLRKNDE